MENQVIVQSPSSHFRKNTASESHGAQLIVPKGRFTIHPHWQVRCFLVSPSSSMSNSFYVFSAWPVKLILTTQS